MTSTTVTHFQENDTDSVCKDCKDRDYLAAGSEYAQLLERLRAQHPEIESALLDLDSAVGHYVAAALDRGMAYGLAGESIA